MKISKSFAIGAGLITFMTLLMVVPSIMFIFNITITKKYLYVGIIGTLIALYVITKDNIKDTIISFLAVVLIIIISVYVSGHIIDTSYDGNGYRKIETGLLKEGWNPIKCSAEEYNYIVKDVPDELASYGNKSNWFWMDAYPKGLAVIGATVYDFTSDIETGKCYTLLSMFTLFFFWVDLTKSKIKKWQSILTGLCMALNPVSLSQMRTFYVDAFVGNLVLVAGILAVKYFWNLKEDNKKSKYVILAIVASTIVMIINDKFNGIAYIGVICLIWWAIVLVEDKKKGEYRESKSIFIWFAMGSVIAFITGISPYISNIWRYGEFLPGIMGGATKVTGAFTTSTKNLGSIAIFFAIIFSKVGDFWTDEQLPLKVPFTYSQEEIDNYYIHATQFGTFGVLFGGIFIICVCGLIYILIKEKRKINNSKKLKITLLFSVLIFLECIIMPIGLGGLRYVSHFYGFVIFVISLMFYFVNVNDLVSRIKMILPILLCVCCLINVYPYSHVLKTSFQDEKNTDKVLSDLYPYKDNLDIAFSTDYFYGLCYNLKDYNIQDYEIISIEEAANAQISVCGGQVVIRNNALIN